jgi:predicted ferric reductase
MQIINRLKHIAAGYYLITGFVLLGVYLFYVAASPLNFTTWFSFFGILGRVTAIAGIILFAISFVLSTRLRFVENLFGGLNRVYIAHHLVASIAFILLLIHPLGLAFRYLGTDNLEAARQLMIRFSPFELDVNLGLAALWILIFLMIITIYIKLPYQLWLTTHKFMGVAFLLGGLHTYLIPSTVSTNNLLRFYVLAWCFIGLGAFAYRTLFGKFIIKKRLATVTATHKEGGNVSVITLNTNDGKPLDFKPGQFVFVRFLVYGLNKEVHPFSIATFVPPNGIQLGIKKLGDFTGRVEDLHVGTEAEIEGAFGGFNYQKTNNKRQLWIAGGIGITPFLAMVQSLHDKKEYDVKLVYSVKEPGEMIGKQLTDYMQNNANFKLVEFIGSQQNGKFLDVNYIAQNVPDYTSRDIFICGPPPMMKGLRTQLVKQGVPNNNIHTEEFSLQ